MLRRQISSAGALIDTPKLINEKGKVSELVETNIGYVTCYTKNPLSNGDKLDFKCELWTKGLAEIFLTYKEPKSASKLNVGTKKITLTGKSAYFLLEIEDGKLKVIEKKSRREETLNVEKERCWVCFRLKRSRIKMLSPTLRDRTASFEQSESVEQTDGSDLMVTPRSSGSLERPALSITRSTSLAVHQLAGERTKVIDKELDLAVTSRNSGSLERPTPSITRSTSLAIHQFAGERVKVIHQELDELKKQQDTVDAALRDFKVQQDTLTNQLNRNQVEINKHLAMRHEIQGRISELKQANVEPCDSCRFDFR